MVSKLGVRRRILAAESRDQRLRARISGEWTKEKLAILGAYAPAFVRACKRAEGGCFIDAFAGSGLNVDRGGREFEGSAQIAAKLPFRAVYLIDNDPANTASLQALNLGGTCGFSPLMQTSCCRLCSVRFLTGFRFSRFLTPRLTSLVGYHRATSQAQQGPRPQAQAVDSCAPAWIWFACFGPMDPPTMGTS